MTWCQSSHVLGYVNSWGTLHEHGGKQTPSTGLRHPSFNVTAVAGRAGGGAGGGAVVTPVQGRVGGAAGGGVDVTAVEGRDVGGAEVTAVGGKAGGGGGAAVDQQWCRCCQRNCSCRWSCELCSHGAVPQPHWPQQAGKSRCWGRHLPGLLLLVAEGEGWRLGSRLRPCLLMWVTPTRQGQTTA